MPQLARALDLPKTTTHRMLLTLSSLGWIRATDGSPTRWMITSKASAIGARLQPDRELRTAVAPAMRALGDATGETIHFSVPDQRYIVLIDKLEARTPFARPPPSAAAPPRTPPRPARPS